MSPFLSQRSRDALLRLAAAEEGETVPDALERIRDIRSLVLELEREPAVLASVRDALSSGANWDEVADAAGLKQGAAKWRWQGTDEEIAARHEAGRKRSARPSSIPTDLPGLSVAEAAKKLDVSVQAVYLRIRRGTIDAQTVELPDGRKYKRVMLDSEPPESSS